MLTFVNNSVLVTLKIFRRVVDNLKSNDKLSVELLPHTSFYLIGTEPFRLQCACRIVNGILG